MTNLTGRILAIIPAVFFLHSCAPDGDDLAPAGIQEATALTGEPLYRPDLSAERQEKLETDLAAAMADLESKPDVADSYIWAGRRLGYLGRYNDAIAMLSRGIEKFPADSRLYRHRGHRYITIRQFPTAIADFERAVELIAGTPDSLEPDGAPNPQGIPTSTRHGNIYYHLGLAHYLMGDYEAALPVYRHAMEIATHPDSTVAVTHWLYSALRRLGRDKEAEATIAAIPSDAEVVESVAYLDLVRLYKGVMTVEEVLAANGGDSSRDPGLLYGIANYLWVNGEQLKSIAMFEDIIAGGGWSAFGYIAAEADLARLD